MAYFDRFDICAAYAALEYDWNAHGILQYRPSCQRRRESVGVQLRRVGYRPALARAGGFVGLNDDNQREIYVNALQAFGYRIEPRDPSHADVLAWLTAANA